MYCPGAPSCRGDLRLEGLRRLGLFLWTALLQGREGTWALTRQNVKLVS